MITVLRLGHRRKRDQRITTHVGLTARALGADQIILSGEEDTSVVGSLEDVVDRWGGPFAVEYRADWRSVLDQFEGVTTHLTMYGLPFQNHVTDIRGQDNDMLVVVGGEKVPKHVYNTVDYNLAVGNQPHSEVAALAVFLYELQDREIPADFTDADVAITPVAAGKHVESLSE